MSEATAALTGATEVPAGDNGSVENTGTTTGENGNSGLNWMSGFDEDSSAFIENKAWKEPADMLSSYRSLEKLVGGSNNVLEMPSADATPEEMDSFYNSLGRPESVDGYSFELPEGGDSEMFEWFRNEAHAEGLTDNQAKNLFSKYEAMAEQRMGDVESQMRQNAEQDIADLKKEWGRDYDKNIDSGTRAVRALGYDEAALSGLEAKMGTSEMLKLFSNIGAKMGEDSFVSGEGSDSFGNTAAGARQQLADLKTDSQFMDKYLSGDKDAVAKYTRLMEKAHG